MRIAIPTYGQWVSPRFDCAGTLVVIDSETKTKKPSVEHSLSTLADADRPAFLTRLNVSVLLCGGIRRRDQVILEESGIEVVAGLMGAWKVILKEFLAKHPLCTSRNEDLGSALDGRNPDPGGCHRGQRRQ